MANEGVEQVELTEPLEALRGCGAEVEFLAPEIGEIQAFNHLDKGERFPVDRAVGEADASEYDGMVLPAEWVDEEGHVDNGLVSSRKPEDLEAFTSKLLEQFAGVGAAATG
jgi:putative intracellular protease/amidase